MRIALLAYYLAFFVIAFVWPTWRLWRRDRINALVLPFDDSAYGVVSKGFRLLILGLFAVLIAALWLPTAQFGPLPWLDHAVVRIGGAALLAGSLVLIVVAQAQMGRSWRIGIDTGRRTALVQTGVSSRSRNPIFLSMRINLFGLLLVWPNAATLTAFLLGEVLMQVQVRLEEDHLGRMLGTEYAGLQAADAALGPGGIGRRNPMLGRRTVLAGFVGLVSASCAEAAPTRDLVVYKTASCPCCGGWVSAMAKAGFRPKVVNVEDISPLWRARGIPDELSSCHVATIGAYFTVGHVPPADVERLLMEAPDAIGLSVPGMPFGSPGMEGPGGVKEPFETLLLLKGGKSRVFSRHS